MHLSCWRMCLASTGNKNTMDALLEKDRFGCLGSGFLSSMSDDTRIRGGTDSSIWYGCTLDARRGGCLV
jgi:hypothetical protein